MEPPVSVPRASGASNAATAAEEPPPEPPGVRSRSHGLRLGPKAECSVEDPMANSSRFVLPRRTRPASRRRDTTVASYGGIHPSRIFEAAVVGMPLVARLSFTAMGTPASAWSVSPAARRSSMAAASLSASSRLTCRKACTAPSTSSMRARCASAAATAVVSPERSCSASSAAVSLVRSVITVPLPESPSRGSECRHRRERRRAPPPA